MLRVPRCIILSVLIATMARAQATAPATQETPLSLPDLFRAELRARNLMVTLLPPQDAPPTLKVGVDDWTIETAADDRRRDGSFTRFSIECDERQGDRWSALHLASVTSEGQNVTINGVGRAGQSFVSVTYIQDVSGGGVRLMVQRARRARARPLDDDRAIDLVQLWNEHQPQVRKYLLPLFNEISATNLLRPRAGDVYRAFESIAADEAALAKVREVLPMFDADSAAERDAASAKLDQIGPSGVLAAMRIDRTDLSPEQRGRLNAFITRHTLWPDPAAARQDPHFLGDCLEDDDPAVRAAALTALRVLAKREITFDLDAPLASRRAAAAELIEAIEQRAAQPAAGGE